MKLLSPSVSTKHPTSEESLHPKSFQSWRWVFLAAILLAAVTISTFYFSSAQAQANKGAITGLTLTSDAPGTLTVSWDTASPTPTDYRVDWAKSTEDYTSWKVNNGHVYAAETATTTTITDLGHDTEYKIRMRARYYKGEHMGKSWGGPWAEATITVAGEPAETPTPEPSPEPTPAPGTIDTLAATDDDAGQLVLTWDPPAAPNAAPTDYHVNWAKSTEDYPADTAEAGNAHPTTTTHTLAGLEYGTDYNIHARARYTDGENAASPWNGPWTEITARVKLPLPMAINMTGAAVSPTSQVFLFWSDPSNDSITGYQILRGPKADSLVVIEDDTGSTSTSYTDETPPAGQTHTYAVKARNPTGLSPLSDTLTATVPAAKKKEVLIVARHESNDDTLVSNLGQTVASATAIVGPLGGSHHEIAMSFTTGTNALGYHPTSIQLYVNKQAGSGTLTPQVSIRGDNAGLPGETALYDLNTSSAITEDFQLITFTTPDEVTLQPNTLYWLHVNTNALGRAGVQQTTSDDEDTESNADWIIGDAKVTRTDGATWTTDAASNSLRMKILGHVAPPPEPDETLVSNLGQTVASATAIVGPSGGSHHEVAMSFTTGTSPFGYHPTSIQLYVNKQAGSGTLTPQFSIRGNNAGVPGETALYDLNTSSAITEDFQLITFTTPDEVTLQPNTLYWLHVNTNALGRAGVQQTTSDDEDTESNADWIIGDAKVTRTDGATWTTDAASNSLRMKILGHVAPPPEPDETLVSNLGQTVSSVTGTVGPYSGNHYEAAMPFTTGNNALGYHLTSMQLYMDQLIPGGDTPTVQVSIRGDNAGLPGDTALYTLTTSSAITSSYQLLTFTTTDEFILQPNTIYWLYANANGGTAEVQQTASDDEDTESQADWRIGDHRVSRIDGGAWVTSTDSLSLKMKILGRVITPTLVSNLGQTAVSGDAYAGFVSGNHHETAMPFTTGSNAFGYQPTSIQLYLSRLSGSPLVYITIREDNAGLPGETTLARLNMSTAITADANIPQLITFTTSGEVTLQPDILYWLHVNANTSVAPAGVRQTASDDEDTHSYPSWRIGDHRVSRIDGGAWVPSTDSLSLQMRILGHIILPKIVDLPADITTTARLAVNESVTGQHEHGRDVDWFAFAAEADTNYQFTANQGQKFATLNVLRIFQDDGTELRNSLIAKKDNAYHGVDRLNNIAFRTDTAGTYYVSIEGWHGGGSNVPYTITMFDDDYSDDITTTGVVDVGESFQNYVMRTGANPESSRTDDVDWIRVALKADVTYEIVYDVACLHQGRIEGIYGPDGTLLPDTTLDWPRKTKGWCTDLTTEFTPSSDDDYYIAVSAQGSHFPIGSVNPFQGVQGTLTITAK